MNKSPQRLAQRPKRGSGPWKKILDRVLLVVLAALIGLIAYFRFGGHRPPAPPETPPAAVRKQMPSQTEGPSPSHPTGGESAPEALPVPVTQKRLKPQPSPSVVTRPGEPMSRAPHPGQPEATYRTNKTDASSTQPEYSDAEPPVLSALWFDPPTAPAGTNVLVFVQATDNLSGVDAVAGRAKSPSGVASLSFSCQKSQDNGQFVGVLEIPDRAETGAWSIASLRLTDNARNLRTYSEKASILQAAHFQVTAADSDNTPPMILDVRVEPEEVRGGEKVHLVIQALDDKSGVARIHGALISPSGNARFSIACTATAQEQIFSGYATMPKDAESGLWSLYYLRAEDQAKNAKTYYRNNEDAFFEKATVRVFAGNSDSEPPSLDDLSLSPGVVAYGETLEITVTASDDVSGVSRVSGRLRSPSGKAHIPFSCTHDPDEDVYRAHVKIANNAEVGTWSVEYIRMVDKARNQRVYGSRNPLVAGAEF
ncbi:MAG: hypothetical protein JRI36_13235, partial [Deltaproteobacteria bacterium]|nr:hypothetical protein [Deltaproteobacteria bacterium]